MKLTQLRCSKKAAQKWFRSKLPIIDWMPKYKKTDAMADLVAGITVGLTLIPQAIAYASLAGLQPQFGLYSGFAGCFVYVFFGSIKQVSIGPTAVVSLLTHYYTHSMNDDFAALLCFLSGVVELSSGLLHFGCLVDFVSLPVTIGFSSAAALIILSSQIKGILGLSFSSDHFVGTWMKIIELLPEIRIQDLILGIFCCAALIGMKKFADLKVKPHAQWKLQAITNNLIWLLSISRNAIVVISFAVMAYVLLKVGHEPFRLTGTIQSGFPLVEVPPFSTTVGNKTYNFFEMCEHLRFGIIVVPLISLLNNMAIAKTFASDDVFDANQEMIALGICNIFASIFGSMPVSGSFSRSALNNASGVRSPLGGLYTSILVIFSIGFLVPYFYYIPRSTLSSILICAVVSMVEYQMIPRMWKESRKDLIPAFVTFFACLGLGVEIGISVGVVLDILYLLYLNARPICSYEIVMLNDSPGYILLKPKLGMTYANSIFIRSKMKDLVLENDLPVVLDCSHISVLDFTAIQYIKAAVAQMKKRGLKLVFYNMPDELVEVLSKLMGRDFVHITTDMEEVNKEILRTLSSIPLSSTAQSSTDIEIKNMSKSSVKPNQKD